ncbi:TPA: beta-1,6-N-acetylglucosaminyltransferase [Streptococcus suis]
MTEVLKINVDLLSPEIDFILHVDKKSRISDFNFLRGKVNFLDERRDVKWGDFSQVEVMLDLMKYALDNNYDFLSIISETDLPLKTSKEINSFLARNKISYIGKMSDSDCVASEYRIKYQFPKFIRRRPTFKSRVFMFLRFYKLFYNNRFDDLGTLKLYKGSQWMTLSNDALRYIFNFLRETPNYIQIFENSFCSDEHFFHTILFNSNLPIFEVVQDGDSINGLRYIDWKSGPDFPKLLRAENIDLYRSQQPDSIFFRKVTDDSDFDRYKRLLFTKY